MNRRRAIAVFAALLGGCNAPAPPPDAAGAAHDASPADASPTMDLRRAPYPPGPYGGHVGQVFPDLALAGYRLSPEHDDPAAAKWDDTVRVAEYHQAPPCRCLVVAYGALWCAACQEEQKVLIAAVKSEPSLCVLGVVQEGDGAAAATRTDVGVWVNRFHQDFTVAEGTPATRALLADVSGGAEVGFPVEFVVRTDDMVVVSAEEGSRPDLPDFALRRCGVR